MLKKTILLIVFCMSCLLAISQNMRIDFRSTTRAEVIHSDFNSLQAVFSYASLESFEVSTEKGLFSEIGLEGCYPSGEIGAPELPVTHQLMAVPFGATPTVNVISFTATDYQLSDYGIHTIYPRQASVRKDQSIEDVEFVYNEAAYQSRGLSDAPLASIEVQGTLRGIRVGSLVVNPVCYDASTQTLRVFNDIKVDVRFEGADVTATEQMLLNTYSPYFDIVYRQMFNYRQIMDVYDDHPDLMAYPVHMIVVTPENYVSTLQPWVNWKIQKGFDVNVVTTAQAGSTYSAIRSYVQNLYNTGVSNEATPTFLILVGDVAQVPNTTGSSSQKVTDLYYGSVDNDYFPDMFYSRMSAENTSQLEAIVNKILQYEQYTMPDPSYLNNVTLIAGWDNYWNAQVAQPTINYATTYYYNADHGFSNVYTHLNQSQYSGCYSNLSSGVGFVNYTAHGNNQEWSQPNLTNSGVNQLSNTDKYFLAMGNCCLAANFGYGQPCFAEAMIRAENKGAYSYIGSCPSTYWYEDYYFALGATNTHGGSTPSNTESTTGCYDGVWMDDTYNTISSMVFLGNLAVCYSHTGGYSTHSSPIYYWQAYHVLGDGSIMPFRLNPAANTVNHNDTFPMNASSFTVSAEEGSYVGISMDNVLLGAALVPASGSVDVSITPVTQEGTVRIVVTKPQRQPYIQDIDVEGGGGTTTAELQVVSATPLNIDAGQNVTFTVTLTNVGTAPTSGNTTVALSTDDPYVSVIQGNATLGVINVDETVSCSFVINASEATPDGHVCTLTAIANYGNSSCEGDFEITVNNPCVAPEQITVYAVNYTDIYIGWSGTSSAVSYNIYRNGELAVSEYPSEYNYYYDTELPYGEYCYYVVANCAQGMSDPTETACATLSIPCDAPSNFTASYIYNGEEDYGVQLEWNNAASILPTFFYLYRSTDNVNFAILDKIEVEGNMHPYVYFDRAEVGTYYYALTAEYIFDNETCMSEEVHADAGVEVTDVAETEDGVRLYPNPADDLITVESTSGAREIRVYDLLGVMVKCVEGTGVKTEVSLEDLPKGVYFVQARTDDNTITQRIIKN